MEEEVKEEEAFSELEVEVKEDGESMEKDEEVNE